jgi:polysaccharide export outer membrane protein
VLEVLYVNIVVIYYKRKNFMKFKAFMLFLLSQLFFLSLANANADANQSYKLRQGDLIQVSVWGEDKMQKESLVLPDGNITYPLAGRVEVAGLTSTEVEKRIAEKLKAYLPDPQVSVVIVSITGNIAHVMGKVLKPGQVLMRGPMTVLDALSIAGGLDKFADRSGIKVLRKTPQGQKAIPVYYDQLIRGQNLESNITLNPGDTILVP